ncbi:hypothetical protein JKP88DRAFT_354004 [Tribonema minus]|uniref:CAP-Gly domain-containing protein n=1 Tax=Tribonema minus TaxID=303371 RepID=A0A836CJP9_9STRA|nr:hypothetical protein JKP88DRAFT_354004 [Tribonema minus]
MLGNLSPKRGISAEDVLLGSVVITKKNKRGLVKYRGTPAGKKGVWLGLELDEVGIHSGAVGGVTYYECREGSGVFVNEVLKVVRGPPAAPTSSKVASPPSAAARRGSVERVRHVSSPQGSRNGGAGVTSAAGGKQMLSKRGSMSSQRSMRGSAMADGRRRTSVTDSERGAPAHYQQPLRRTSVSSVTSSRVAAAAAAHAATPGSPVGSSSARQRSGDSSSRAASQTNSHLRHGNMRPPPPPTQEQQRVAAAAVRRQPQEHQRHASGSGGSGGERVQGVLETNKALIKRMGAACDGSDGDGDSEASAAADAPAEHRRAPPPPAAAAAPGGDAARASGAAAATAGGGRRRSSVLDALNAGDAEANKWVLDTAARALAEDPECSLSVAVRTIARETAAEAVQVGVGHAVKSRVEEYLSRGAELHKGHVAALEGRVSEGLAAVAQRLADVERLVEQQQQQRSEGGGGGGAGRSAEAEGEVEALKQLLRHAYALAMESEALMAKEREEHAAAVDGLIQQLRGDDLKFGAALPPAHPTSAAGS